MRASPSEAQGMGRAARILAQADVQFAQLLLVDAARRVGQQALGALGLGEGDHVADRLGAGHHGDDAVEAEGQAAVRRRAVLERVEQEAELGLLLLGPMLSASNTLPARRRGGYAPSRRRSPSR
jgi:hypothetical protein